MLSDDANTLLVGSLDEDCRATGVNPADPCDNDREGDISTGAAYVFARTGTTWSQQAFFKASNTGANDWFGSRLALSGDGNTAAMGASLEDTLGRGINGNQEGNDATESGAVYLFTRSGTTWRQDAYIKGSNTEAFDQIGSAVALSRGMAARWWRRRSARTVRAANANGNQATTRPWSRAPLTCSASRRRRHRSELQPAAGSGSALGRVLSDPPGDIMNLGSRRTILGCCRHGGRCGRWPW